MKKLILAVTVAAFTVAAYAGGEACSAKEKSACSDSKAVSACSASKAVAKEGKAQCSMATKQAKASGCCGAKEVKQALLSPKAASK